MKILSLIGICSALASPIRAVETNLVFLTVSPKAAFGQPASNQVYAGQLEAAKGMPASRPAELDPEGHWGAITSGLQLSVRFPTNVFVSGRPVDMTVLLRNTTTNRLILPGAGAITLELFVLNSQHEPLAATNRSLWLTYSGPGHTGLPPRTQVPYQFRLSDIFDLTSPGRYYVYAKRQKFDWAGVPEVTSGMAEVTIAKPSPPSGTGS